MRWPWRREQRDGPTAGDGRARVAVPATPAPMGWAFLPPLQRTVGTLDPVTAPLGFPQQLPAWGNPSRTAPGLAHVVSPEAPSGIVDGDGRGSATGEPQHLAHHVELTLLPPPAHPVQRATRSRPPATPLTSAVTVTGLPALQRSVVAEPTPAEAPDAPVDDLDLPHVEVAAGEPGPASPGGPPADPPAPPTTPTLVDRPAMAADPVAPETSPALPLSPGSDHTGPGAAARPADVAALAPDPAPVQRAVAPPGPSVPGDGPDAPTARPPSPARPRLALGPPMASVPASAVPERVPEPRSATAAAEIEPEPPTPAPAPDLLLPPVQAARDLPDAPEEVEGTLAETPVLPRTSPLLAATTTPTPGPPPRGSGTRPAPPPPVVSRALDPPAAPAPPHHDVRLAPGSSAASSAAYPAASSAGAAMPVRPAIASPAAPEEAPEPPAASPPVAPDEPPEEPVRPDPPATATTTGLSDVPVVSRATGAAPAPVPGPPTTGPAPSPLPLGPGPAPAATAVAASTAAGAALASSVPVGRPTLMRVLDRGTATAGRGAPTAAQTPLPGPVPPRSAAAAVRVQRSASPVPPATAPSAPPLTAPRVPPATPTLYAASRAARPTTATAPVALLEPPAEQTPAVQLALAPSTPAPAPERSTTHGPGELTPGPELFSRGLHVVAAASVQRAEVAAPPPAAPPTAAVEVAEAPAGPGSGGAAAAATSSPEQLEVLAGRLWPSVLRRIRHELLLDRERLGVRTDAW